MSRLDEQLSAVPAGKALLWYPRSGRFRVLADPHPHLPSKRLDAAERFGGRRWYPTARGWAYEAEGAKTDGS